MKTKSFTLYGTEINGNYANISVVITEKAGIHSPRFSFLYLHDRSRIQENRRRGRLKQRDIREESQTQALPTPAATPAPTQQPESEFVKRNKGLLYQQQTTTLTARIRNFINKIRRGNKK